MKITITSQDIAKRNEMTAEEWAKYLLMKMQERKAERMSVLNAAFEGFGG